MPNNCQVKLNLAQAGPDKSNFDAKLRDCAKLNPTLARTDRPNFGAKLRLLETGWNIQEGWKSQEGRISRGWRGGQM